MLALLQTHRDAHDVSSASVVGASVVVRRRSLPRCLGTLCGASATLLAADGSGSTQLDFISVRVGTLRWSRQRVPPNPSMRQGQRAACLSGRCLGPSCLLPQCHAATQSRRRGPGADATSVSVGGSGRVRETALSLCRRDTTMRVSLRKALQQRQWQPQWQRRLSPLCLSTATRSLCRLRTHSHAPWR